MATFAAYFSFANADTQWLTKSEHAGSFNNIETAYLHLFLNQKAFGIEKKAINVDCYVKQGGKRVYMNDAQGANVRRLMDQAKADDRELEKR
jgi:hypothetical protein